jgi:nifR3 family TIM-barrel protein
LVEGNFADGAHQVVNPVYFCVMKFCGFELRSNPLFLAPMEDVTDTAFRKFCKSFGGVDFMYTEFISADGLLHNGKKSLHKLNLNSEERPIGIQIYGHQPDSMVEAARLAEQAGPEILDINFGCPVKKIANRGAGSGMMRNVPLMVEITQKIVEAVKIPVTVKTRLGWDEKTKNIVDVAERLQDVGIQAITIHGRTRSQMYTGIADWTLIGEVKNNPRMTIPVIGNGDVDSPEKAFEMFSRYGVDGIMIGRPTIGRPWIFSEIRHYLDQGSLLPAPSIAQQVDWVKQHLRLNVLERGEYVGVLLIRRHFAKYFKSLPDFRDLKVRLLTAPTEEACLGVLDEIRARYS